MNYLKCLCIFAIVLLACNSSSESNNKSDDSTVKKHKKHKTNLSRFVEQQWEMPNDLREISGMAFINDNQLACIQDEFGIIFIYDLKKEEVTNKIGFAGKGDFEGIAMVGFTAYVLRSDGVITEIKDIRNGEHISIIIHPTGMSKLQNTEGLCYDKEKNRLLISCKGSNLDKSASNSVWAFDLKSKELLPEPILTINTNDPVFNKEEETEMFQPSEIAFNALNKDFYFTDSPANKLFIVSNDGKIREKKLEKSVLPQPEGLAINNKGELFLSSEGVDGPGIIVKVSSDFLK
jgi:uncharacterized protein YjiK